MAGLSEHVLGPPKLEPEEAFPSYELIVPSFCYVTKWFTLSVLRILEAKIHREAFFRIIDSRGLWRKISRLFLGLQITIPVFSPRLCSAFLSVQFPRLCKDTSHIGIGAFVMTPG